MGTCSHEHPFQSEYSKRIVVLYALLVNQWFSGRILILRTDVNECNKMDAVVVNLDLQACELVGRRFIISSTKVDSFSVNHGGLECTTSLFVPWKYSFFEWERLKTVIVIIARVHQEFKMKCNMVLQRNFGRAFRRQLLAQKMCSPSLNWIHSKTVQSVELNVYSIWQRLR